MTDNCGHQFVNTQYREDGNVTVTCSTCRADVTKPHHAEIAKVYLAAALPCDEETDA